MTGNDWWSVFGQQQITNSTGQAPNTEKETKPQTQNKSYLNEPAQTDTFTPTKKTNSTFLQGNVGINNGSYTMNMPAEIKYKEISDEWGNTFELTQEISLNINYTSTNGTTKTYPITIPSGFRWNGASIPGIFEPILGHDTDKEFLQAGMIHDYLCSNKDKVDNNIPLTSAIFRDLLIMNGVSSSKANSMAYGVDLGQDAEKLYKDTTNSFGSFINSFKEDYDTIASQ